MRKYNYFVFVFYQDIFLLTYFLFILANIKFFIGIGVLVQKNIYDH
jgi:hypothetical protein